MFAAAYLRNLINTVLLYTVFASMGVVIANEEIKEEQQLPQHWYQIEVIVFESPARAHSEYLGNQRYLKIQDEALNSHSEELTPIYQPVAKDELELNAIVSKLENNQRNILIHTAWVQNLAERTHSVPMRIQGGETFESHYGNETRLDGTLTVSLSRYLHVDTDLQLLNTHQSQVKGFNLTDSRRMRSNEIHYIDHPAFGIIVKITPQPKKAIPLEG